MGLLGEQHTQLYPSLFKYGFNIFFIFFSFSYYYDEYADKGKIIFGNNQGISDKRYEETGIMM